MVDLCDFDLSFNCGFVVFKGFLLRNLGVVYYKTCYLGVFRYKKFRIAEDLIINFTCF